MEICSVPLSRRWNVDQMVVSVGPYTFQVRPGSRTSCSARAGGRASPPTRTRSEPSLCQPASTRRCQVAGVACMTVAPVSASSPASRRPSTACSLVTTCTRAPLMSGAYSSRPAMSKVTGVTAARVSPGASPVSRAIARSRLTRLRWVTSTPLGRPVEPEV